MKNHGNRIVETEIAMVAIKADSVTYYKLELSEFG